MVGLSMVAVGGCRTVEGTAETAVPDDTPACVCAM